ncbi:hypothetical protein CVS40_2982 [Lucilia cuprina]|nr:hypothetical protein CVS40_2982 [Lucilia cuprina]
MDSHSKNVFLIGILHIVGYALFTLQPVTKVITMISEDQLNGRMLLSLMGVFGFCILMVILASLMLRGVIRQNYLLVAPFFIFYTFILSATFVWFLIRIFMDFKIAAFCFYQYHLYMYGLHALILYPVYTLMSKLRLRYLKEKALNDTFSEKEKKSTNILASV